MHTQEDERLADVLRRILEEGLDPTSHEAQSLHEGIARSQAVIGLLERSGRVQRADLSADAGELDPRHAGQVRDFVLARTARPAIVRRPWVLALVSALAAALLIWMGPLRSAAPTGGDEIHLGSTVAVELTADGLTIDYALAQGGHFEVVARDAAGETLASSGELYAPLWPLTAEQRAAWPADVTFEVSVFDGTGAREPVTTVQR